MVEPAAPEASALVETLVKVVCDLIRTQGQEHWWIKGEFHRIFEAHGFQIQPKHFYSPLPSPEVVASYDWSSRPFPLDRINFNLDAWRRALVQIGENAAEFARTEFPLLGNGTFPWGNPFYTELDALALYSNIRTYRPRRIIEIGSGYSTHVALAAIERNQTGRITCIEPYPTAVLAQLSSSVEVLCQTAQQTPLTLFDDLTANDLLFIDSSHVSAFQSDVNHEIFEILPRLAPGVIVHVHDIFFPWDYPKSWVDERHWFWTEQYLLYAFLLQNPCWEVFFPTFYTWNAAADEIARSISPEVPCRSGVGLWLRRLGAKPYAGHASHPTTY